MSPILTDGLRSVGRAWPAGDKRLFERKRKTESDAGQNLLAAGPLTVDRRSCDRVSRQRPGASPKEASPKAVAKGAAQQAARHGAAHGPLRAGSRLLAVALMVVVMVIVARRRRLSLRAGREARDQCGRHSACQQTTHHRSPKRQRVKNGRQPPRFLRWVLASDGF